ncbi:S-adenosyl-L-methionine-dependent methyltransferase [Pseudovirgaria hyperparasitica]|uniref:S-adenosyl-L-methionine-dependent methyltransferase n=1 Tax=Pseudovirgaria hyperparasitica TaxID=470096 RepID=A0A6A6WL08_9PEZI|nr:S-adenosyl-L-methionine-dependent methyltransferase [Pseudovirgaria hyperparasitica]KAF2762861.1 S-adenosyl-L-methionine-dependent methyltransferase [Pseudovirgaria hyperparasitica]
MADIPRNNAFYAEEIADADASGETAFVSMTDTDTSAYHETALQAIDPDSNPVATEPETFSQAVESASQQLRNELARSRAVESFSTTDTDPSDYQEQAIESYAASQMDTTTPRAEQRPQFSETTSTDVQLKSQLCSPLASLAPAQPSSRSVTVQYIPTENAYDKWSAVYDSDGNVLQAIDDLELEQWLPQFLDLACRSVSTPATTILDVGCGTGRNTAKVFAVQTSTNCPTHVTGIDLSSGMLTVAEKKLRPFATENVTLELVHADLFSPSTLPSLPLGDALISTLVLEHIELDPYFRVLSSLLRPGGYALVTNMHKEMGMQTQAGFNATDGTKIRGTSWAHGLPETIRAAHKEGLELVGNARERSVEESMIGNQVGERGRKWIGVNICSASPKEQTLDEGKAGHSETMSSGQNGYVDTTGSGWFSEVCALIRFTRKKIGAGSYDVFLVLNSLGPVSKHDGLAVLVSGSYSALAISHITTHITSATRDAYRPMRRISSDFKKHWTGHQEGGWMAVAVVIAPGEDVVF